MNGNISNTYTLVPQFQGKYPISSVDFTFFNTSLKKYETLKTKEIIVNVLEGPTLLTEKVDPQNSTTPSTILPSINQFKFIKTKPNLVNINSSSFINSTYFYIIIFLPFFIIILTVIFFKSKKITDSDLKKYKSISANKLARKYLFEAKKNLDKKDMFYVSLEKAMHNFLKSKLSIETSDYSKERIQDLLKNRNVDDDTQKLFIRFLTY